jgi:hypothetical protein
MHRSITVRGRLSDPRHIELSEPVPDIGGEVEIEILIRPVPEVKGADVFALIADLRPGSRTKTDIDHQIQEERASWGDR